VLFSIIHSTSIHLSGTDEVLQDSGDRDLYRRIMTLPEPSHQVLDAPIQDAIAQRAELLVTKQQQIAHCQTDRLFLQLLLAQWFLSLALLFMFPKNMDMAWHLEIIILIILSLPVYFIIKMP